MQLGSAPQAAVCSGVICAWVLLYHSVILKGLSFLTLMQVNNFAIANSSSISVELTVLSNNYCKEVEVFLPSLSLVFTDCKYFITAIIGGKEKPEDFK